MPLRPRATHAILARDEIMNSLRLREKYFVLLFHFDFSANFLFPKFIVLTFPNSVFDFQNDVDMDLTHVTASVVGGQQYSRSGNSDIYHGRTRQRGCVPRKLPQQPSVA